MKAIKFFGVIFLSLLIKGCAPLKPAVVVKNSSIESYKYIYVSPTESLTSSTGSVYGGEYGTYGATTSKSVNPSDVISGILVKEGFIRLPELKSDLTDQTLIVNYGESGRRNRGLGYTIELQYNLFLQNQTN